MKYLTAILILICFTSFEKTNSFRIYAKITGIPDSTVLMLQNLRTGDFLDSCMVMDASFSFSGHIPDGEPEELRVISSLQDLKKGNLYYTDLLIGNESVSVTGDVSDLPHNVTTKGSRSQSEAEIYYKELHRWNQKIDRMKSSLAAADSTKKEELNSTLQSFRDSLEEWKTSYIKRNFDKYIALLLYNYRKDFTADTLKALFSTTPTKIKKSKYGKAVELQIKYPKLSLGADIYDFKARNTKGEEIRLSDFTGKHLLLQFAGTGCYWSGLSLKDMIVIYPTYENSVTFVSYFTDPKDSTWLATVGKEQISWPSMWSAGGKYSVPYNAYSITGTPTFFLFSPEGKLLTSWFGFDSGIIEKELKKHIEL